MTDGFKVRGGKTATDKNADEKERKFVEKADGGKVEVTETKEKEKEKTQQITVSLYPDDIKKLDEIRKKKGGLSRGALLRMWISEHSETT